MPGIRHPITNGHPEFILSEAKDLAKERSEGPAKDLLHYYVYIMSSRSRTLYTGVTNNLIRRVFEHKEGVGSQFTRKYRITRLVHFEETTDVQAALTREKQIKSWTRARKLQLIDADNPEWKDLSADWEAPA